ncbi:MAG: uracil-DNA glycosylase [Pirellulales bacterium]|nr:uracil-DNA glycosylase [Pirellulales bacterium]
MKESTKDVRRRAARIVEQALESLHRSGVTHVKKLPLPPPAIPTAAVTAENPSRSTPMPRSQGKKVLPSLTQIAQLEQSTDPRCRELGNVAREVSDCTRCAELARTRTQTVFGAGNPSARLVFCGEAPGADEDRLGEPFVGRAGQLLTDIIVKGMKMRREDVYILNILRCRPPGNRTPSPVEAAACREYLDRQLAIIQPEFICCLGACAAQNLLQTDAAIGRLRSKMHDFNGVKVVCTYHPAYLLRNPAAKKQVWEDIQMLLAEMGMK